MFDQGGVREMRSLEEDFADFTDRSYVAGPEPADEALTGLLTHHLDKLESVRSPEQRLREWHAALDTKGEAMSDSTFGTDG
ncbi:hypothetical protein ACFWWS_38545, partial [Streptomyces sp. NPDC059083]|uniref:hypothetical protein n=1 Tax=Streptomyces sp. NPDC059083 TaxID=3346721 RepID=UPI0036BBF171